MQMMDEDEDEDDNTINSRSLRERHEQKEDDQAILTFAKSRSRKKWPIVVASLMLVAFLVV